jgi:hypothetical protein
MPPLLEPPPLPDPRRHPAWVRALWLAAGVTALVLGVVGIFVPLLPTTPFVLLAAWCFSRGCARCEAWLLAHPRLGPIVHDWRARRAVPLRAKQLATVMMAVGCALAWTRLPSPWHWAPLVVCAGVATWMWRLPTRPARA